MKPNLTPGTQREQSEMAAPIQSVRKFYAIESSPALDAVEMSWSEERRIDAEIDMTDRQTKEVR